MQSGGVWQTRIKEWQGMTVQLANEHLPVVYSWLSSQVDSFVVQQNLTEVRAAAFVLPALLALLHVPSGRCLAALPVAQSAC